MKKLMAGVALLVILSATSTALATQQDLVIAVAVRDPAQIAALQHRAASGEFELKILDSDVLAVANQLLSEIDAGRVAQSGEGKPGAIAALSKSILTSIPDIFHAQSVRVISPQLVPIELLEEDGRFLGDQVIISHQFVPGDFREETSVREIAFARYVIDAVIEMPRGMKRIDQDIVRVALALEGRIPTELQFDSNAIRLRRTLMAGDASILHIDTHGTWRGRSIQASRRGEFLAAADVPRNIEISLVLLFGCEGVADADSFGSVLARNGVAAVISSYAKFQSFGVTGDPEKESRVYSAFFDALLDGKDFGAALLQFRRAALGAVPTGTGPTTLTRLFFALVGNNRIKFRFRP